MRECLRWAVWFALTITLASAATHAKSARDYSPPLKTIAVLDFDLQDDNAIQGAAVDDAGQQRRLRLIAAELRRALAERNLYVVADNAPAAQLVERARKMQALSDCNGCEIEIAQALKAERVMVGWVHKVSNLIININIGVKDVESGQVLYVRSADLRGNTDESWLRAIKRLAREIEEKRLHVR